jgi:hypothetical protein
MKVQNTQDPDILKNQLIELVIAQKTGCEGKFANKVSLNSNVKIALQYTGIAITAGVAIATGVGAIAMAAGGITAAATSAATLFTTTIPNTIAVPSNAGVTQAVADMEKYAANNPNLNSSDFQVYRDYLAYCCFQEVTNSVPQEGTPPSKAATGNKAPAGNAPGAGSPKSSPASSAKPVG